MGFRSAGSTSFTCRFEKDVLYPGEQINLTLLIDNTKCSCKIDKYKIKLLRRTQVFNLKTKSPIYTNDCILVSEKMNAKCAAKKQEERIFQFTIPQSIFLTKQEEDRIKVPLVEKPLAQGPASSLSGRLFKV